MTVKKVVDYLGLGKPEREVSLGQKGASGSKMLEPKPKYIKAENELVIEGLNDARIVLGRDRPGSRISGYGHEHKSSRIDLVVGSVASDSIGTVNGKGEKMYVDPSPKKDAARIYISQKSNIDDYYNLDPGRVGMSRSRSAIAVKADAVRIVGREGIKLVTRPEPINSQGGKIEYVSGIDLIAGNDDRDLQPLVKGKSLVKALDNIYNWIGKMNGIVDGILLEQMQLNAAFATHTHIVQAGPWPGLAFPSIGGATVGAKVGIMNFKQAIDMKVHRTKGVFSKMNTLKPWGRDYILSRYNNTN